MSAARSVHVQRAARVLKGAAVGGHGGAAVVCSLFFLTRGTDSGVSCLIACAITLLFYVVGQAVQVMVADADAKKILVASLVSYGARVGALAGLLALSYSVQEKLSFLDPEAVVAGTVTVVVSWIVTEVVVISRLRVPAYETDQ